MAAFHARIDDQSLKAELLTCEGAWKPTDPFETTMGREVSEADALGFWATR